MPRYIAETWEEVSKALPFENVVDDDDLAAFRYFFYFGAMAVVRQVERAGRPSLEVMGEIHQEVTEYIELLKEAKAGA